MSTFRKRIEAAILTAFVAFLIGCSDSTVVLQNQDGSKRLVYDPNNYRPQVESPEDLGILLNAAGATIRIAAQNRAIVTVDEIADGIQNSDWRRVERLVVEYRANHKSDFK